MQIVLFHSLRKIKSLNGYNLNENDIFVDIKDSFALCMSCFKEAMIKSSLP